MKKCFYILAALLMGFAMEGSAAPGDTTWVQANNRRLDNGNGYGPYDTSVAFPSGSTSYRKVFMVFNLGEYPCPAGAQYCHQWDYTVTNFLITTAGDTLELSRLITPYANTGVPRFPATWNKDYVFDVTDYAAKLQNTAISRIFYSGYSAGFTANVRFAFIEGTPERNVVGMSKLWRGSWNYGKASDPIDNYVTMQSLTAPSGTQSAEMKFTITGHGSDNNGCCEFMSHDYTVKTNGTTTDTKTIWKDDCGSNQVYPQGGTWIYNRANWCPGELINVNTHVLPGITAGNAFTTDVDFDAYTAGNTSYGSYTIGANVIYYGAYNNTVDGSVVDIIAPTNRDEHFRENPSGSKPIIRIRNNGSTILTSALINYGVKDSVMAQYTWNGSLAPSAETQIELPALNTLTNMSMAANTGIFKFVAEIAKVNGTADNNPTNNTLTSNFVVAPTWDNKLLITMKTNSEGVNGIGSGASETSWTITDMSNNIVASRTNAMVSTIYADTVIIPVNGFYKLSIKDGGCDGLHWWVWDQNPGQGITAGTFSVKKLGTAANLPMNGYTYAGTYGNDFGCGYSQYFSTKTAATGIRFISSDKASMEAYPNPASAQVSVLVQGLSNTAGSLILADLMGRSVLQQVYTPGIATMNVSDIAAGVYQLTYRSAADGNIRVTQKIVITK